MVKRKIKFYNMQLWVLISVSENLFIIIYYIYKTFSDNVNYHYYNKITIHTAYG